ncbi:NYN domain-containing protein [Albidovulum sp.]|uniref:NYN domain-containing protein n=1 Tax=Albidovulum sp. TaxID=1872424 RepID=UPI001D7651C4|nr:hypothetical protein [Paracoccaceae bacterium]MCC0046302.1 hypothetical protein [Defluviimonas sp.]HPE25773.1 hypothetical protein [Albidovulum sp.]MCB2118770.1 hypothetical protein [Paracoccaceae bacterium]MCB2121185.1 hypothetical protein [Paracoccaceae bacterium]
MAYAASILVLSLLVLAGAFLAGQSLLSVAILGPATVAAVMLVWIIGQALQPRRYWIVVDGSNVLHWREGPPDISTVAMVAAELRRMGYTPVVWFDANVGQLVAERDLGRVALARLMRLPSIQVLVAPKGMPADPLLLAGARNLQARIVTNSRYPEWSDDYPEIAEAGRLVRGSITDSSVQLVLAPAETEETA